MEIEDGNDDNQNCISNNNICHAIYCGFYKQQTLSGQRRCFVYIQKSMESYISVNATDFNSNIKEVIEDENDD